MNSTGYFRKTIYSWLLICSILLAAVGCTQPIVQQTDAPVTTAGAKFDSLVIINGDSVELSVGSVFSLSTNAPDDALDRLQWFSSMPYATVDELGRVTAVASSATALG